MRCISFVTERLTHSLPCLLPHQTALHYLSSLPHPSHASLNYNFCLQKRSANPTPSAVARASCTATPATHTHDTHFVALLDCDALAGGASADFAFAALDALLSAKAVGFSRCQISSGSGGVSEVYIGLTLHLRQLLQKPSCQARPLQHRSSFLDAFH